MARYRIKRKGDSYIRDGLILLGIMLVLGLIVGVTFRMTGSTIDEGARAARDEAYTKAFGREDVTPHEDDKVNSIIEEYGENLSDGDIASGTRVMDGVVMKDGSGNTAGYAFIASSGGYNGDVTVSVGIDTDGIVKGIDIVSMNETAGLGANCTEPEFKAQFKGLSDRVIVRGSDNSANEGIDALSGATITTEAVINTVNACLKMAEYMNN